MTALFFISVLASWVDVLRSSYYLNRETATTDGYILIRNLSRDKHGDEVLIYYEVGLQQIFSEHTIQKKDLKDYYPKRKVKIKFSIERPEINRIIMFYDSSKDMLSAEHEAILKEIESTK